MRTIEDMIRTEVHYCVSSLVSTLASGYGMIQPDRPGVSTVAELTALTEQAFELCSPIDDWEETARDNGWTETPEGWWWREPFTDEEHEKADFYFLGSGPFVKVETAAQACDYSGEPAYQFEVFEHWIVSDWLADKLEAKGEKVARDFAGLTVWARTTSGQAIYADSVIEAIYRETHHA